MESLISNDCFLCRSQLFPYNSQAVQAPGAIPRSSLLYCCSPPPWKIPVLFYVYKHVWFGVFFVVVIGFWFRFGGFLACKTHSCLSWLWRGSALGADLNLAFQSFSFVLHQYSLMCLLSQHFFKVFKQNTYLH